MCGAILYPMAHRYVGVTMYTLLQIFCDTCHHADKLCVPYFTCYQTFVRYFICLLRQAYCVCSVSNNRWLIIVVSTTNNLMSLFIYNASLFLYIRPLSKVYNASM
jgi:hypothetical protein